MIIFFLETYLDLTIGGLLNTENDYLLDDPDNWGRRAMLTKSDQFCIIFGNIIYIGTNVFPFIIMYLLQQKYELRYMNKYMRSGFDHYYDVLYEGLKTQTKGPYQYWSIYLLRKLIFSYIVFYFMDIEYTLFQIVLNMLLSFSFLMYLAFMKPYISNTDNNI